MPKNTVRRRQLFTEENFEISETVDDVKPLVVEKKVKNEKEEKSKSKESKKKNNDNHSIEVMNNCFSVFYKPNFPIKESDLEDLLDTEKELKLYEHKDSIDFAAATWQWMENDVENVAPAKNRPRGKVGTMPTFLCSKMTGSRAMYRVICESEDAYILMACHQNTHGKHRGDLRFVEVNDKTMTKGIDESVIGNLFIGDIVTVTELSITEHFKIPFKPPKVTDVIFDEKMKCQWMVRRMSILPRNLKFNVQFAIMDDNGTAIVNGFGEAMNVKLDQLCPLTKDEIYIGDVFILQKSESNFTEDHHENSLNRLISLSSDIPSIASKCCVGTIYQYTVSSKYTEMFKVGIEAFKDPKTARNGEETVEFCALLGYSAAKTVFAAHDDYRKFVMRSPKRDGNLVRFSIDNPKNQPTDGFWHSNGRIRFRRREEKKQIHAMIETVICEGDHLNIVARLSRDAPHDVDFKEDLYTVQQRRPFDSSLIDEGFFSELDNNSNGKRIIRALYGGEKIQFSNYFIDKKRYHFPSKDPIQLNEFQCDYVDRVLIETPIVVANSPFGCGKSMTIVTASLYLFEKQKREKATKTQQLLITQSNYASVNLVDIALKTIDRVKDVKFLRYVSEQNWKEMPDACRTSLDMPKLMNDTLVKWATHTDKNLKYPNIRAVVMVQIVSYVMKTLGIQCTRLNPLALSVIGEAMRARPPWPKKMLEPFFTLYQPDIIIVTASSLPGLLSSPFLSKQLISTVQIDEASQLAEYTLLSLLTLLPDARFGLIGDIQQLAPYCEEELTGKLKDYGIGNAMERAVKECLFPQVILKCVYRCHPATTQLLGELFYNNELISGVTEQQRSEFMSNRPQFWPNANFPIMVVDNKSSAQPMGTSFANRIERQIVTQIIDFLTDTQRKKYILKAEDIGVISYYSAQTALLTEALREIGVKCGTVDSFQGSEREIIILCCTNDDIQEFMQVKNRLNVAMSRSKQVTILVGNVEMLKKVEYWSTIIDRCEKNGCVVDTNKYPFKVMPPGANSNSKKSLRKNDQVSKLAKELKEIVTLASSKRKK